MEYPFAGLLKDVLAFFGAVPKWMRVGKTPDRLDELEKRVAELEKLLERRPGEGCPRCGERTYRVMESKPAPRPFDKAGHRDLHMKCSSCGFKDVVRRGPE